VHTVTLWDFQPKLDRSEKEISYLMKLYRKLIDDFLDEAKENKVRIYHLGRRDRLPAAFYPKLSRRKRKQNTLKNTL